MDALTEFIIAMRILDTGASIITALSLLALAIHELRKPRQ